jgi:hypothetical protein
MVVEECDELARQPYPYRPRKQSYPKLLGGIANLNLQLGIPLVLLYYLVKSGDCFARNIVEPGFKGN